MKNCDFPDEGNYRLCIVDKRDFNFAPCTMFGLECRLDRIGYEIIEKGVPASMRKVMTSLARELEAVTKNLTATQELANKYLEELRALRREFASTAPGVIIEDRDVWKKRALEAEATLEAVVRKFVPELMWGKSIVMGGRTIYYGDVNEYHVEVWNCDASDDWFGKVWGCDLKLSLFTTSDRDLDVVKVRVADFVRNTIIGGTDVVQRNVSG